MLCCFTPNVLGFGLNGRWMIVDRFRARNKPLGIVWPHQPSLRGRLEGRLNLQHVPERLMIFPMNSWKDFGT